MAVIEIRTLIDITNTKVIRIGQGTELQLNQQRNFITLMQCIEIRSIVFYDKSPEILPEQDIKKLGFGTIYKGKHKVWMFKFNTDRDGVYQDDSGDPLGHLIEDLHEVPVIKNLSETINIDKPIFDSKDQLLKNIIIRTVS
jgi:hypothetical protein